MSDIYWRRVLAIGLIAIAAGAVIAWLYYAHQQQQYGEATDQNSAQAYSEAEDACASVSGFFNKLHCILDETEAAKETKRNEADLKAQQDMALFALITAIGAVISLGIGGAGVYYVAKTLDATRIAAEATVRTDETAREIGEAQSRAYLAARGGRLRIDTQTADIKFTVEIFNFGNSPATDIRFYGIAGIGPRNLEFPRKTIMRPCMRISEIPVRLFRELRGGMFVGFVEPEFPFILDGNLYLYLAGNLSYRDVFGKTHHTKIAVSGYTSDSPIDSEGYAEADLKPTNPGIWDQTGNADPTS